MLWVSLSLENIRPIVIETVYHPPQGNYANCCENNSEAFNQANLKDNTDIFLLKDLNINYQDKAAPNCKELVFTTRSLGLREIINAPT